MASSHQYIKLSLLLLFCGSALSIEACDFPLSKTETITREFSFGNDVKTPNLLVDNINGFIHVETYQGDKMILSVERTVSARDEDCMSKALREVTLDIETLNDEVKLYVDGPFRRDDGSINFRGSEYYGYENQFNFTLKVPEKTDYRLRTINDGDILVEGVSGDFDINIINGPVTMNNVSGSGKVYSLNGGVEMVFSKNPEDGCRFGSLNGKVRIQFIDDLNADLFLKTHNGGIYTNFEVSPIPASAWPERARTKVEKSGNMNIYRTGSDGVRIGSGGVPLEFDTFNGDIEIIRG